MASIDKFLIVSKPRVAILYSSFTKTIMPDESPWVEANIATCKKFLTFQDKKYVVLSVEEIEKALSAI